MAKMSASFFRRMTLGMALVSGVMMAYEDEKLTKEEIVGILNQLFIGLGMEVDFHGMTVIPTADGGIDIHLPSELIGKLS
jgi:hypothetical protein